MVDLDQGTACETQWPLNYFHVSATITVRREIENTNSDENETDYECKII